MTPCVLLKKDQCGFEYYTSFTTLIYSGPNVSLHFNLARHLDHRNKLCFTQVSTRV